MDYITIGIIGFFMTFFFDLVSIKRIPILKGFLLVMVAVLILYAELMVCINGEKFPIPPSLQYSGIFLLLIFIILFIYSIFLELPFKETYFCAGYASRLVKTGSYALVRHPGVLWFSGIQASLIFVSRSKLMLIAAPIWIFMDLLLIMVQERFYFRRMFQGYDDYMQETPMLVPTRSSIMRCLRTLTQD